MTGVYLLIVLAVGNPAFAPNGVSQQRLSFRTPQECASFRDNLMDVWAGDPVMKKINVSLTCVHTGHMDPDHG